MNFSPASPRNAQLRLLIALTLFFALLLSVSPVPAWMRWFWPSWVGLALLYWGFHQPGVIGVLGAWGIGLILDMLLGGPWGRYALSMALVMRLEMTLHKRLVLARSAPQQTPLIFILLLLLILCAGVINLLFGMPPEFFLGLPALAGALLWVPLHLFPPRRFSLAV